MEYCLEHVRRITPDCPEDTDGDDDGVENNTGRPAAAIGECSESS